MPDTKSAKKPTQRSAKRASSKTSEGFTAEERAAMRERAHETKKTGRRNSGGAKTDGESEVLAKIAEMPASDRALAERIHAIVKAGAPALSPKTWYGMPAYAKDDKVVCFFQSAQKFKSPVRHPRLQRQGEPRRRQHVADRIRAEAVDRQGRGPDHRVAGEGGQLGLS